MQNNQIQELSRNEILAAQDLKEAVELKTTGTIPGFFVQNTITGQTSLVKMANQEVDSDDCLPQQSTPTLIMEFIGARVEKFLLDHLTTAFDIATIEVPEVSTIKLENGNWGLKIAFIPGAGTLLNKKASKTSKSLRTDVTDFSALHSVIFPVAHACGDNDASPQNILQKQQDDQSTSRYRIDFGNFLSFAFIDPIFFNVVENGVISKAYPASMEAKIVQRKQPYELLNELITEPNGKLQQVINKAIEDLEIELSKIPGFDISKVSFKNYFKKYEADITEKTFKTFAKLGQRVYASIIGNLVIASEAIELQCNRLAEPSVSTDRSSLPSANSPALDNIDHFGSPSSASSLIASPSSESEFADESLSPSASLSLPNDVYPMAAAAAAAPRLKPLSPQHHHAMAAGTGIFSGQSNFAFGISSPLGAFGHQSSTTTFINNIPQAPLLQAKAASSRRQLFMPSIPSIPAAAANSLGAYTPVSITSSDEAHASLSRLREKSRATLYEAVAAANYSPIKSPEKKKRSYAGSVISQAHPSSQTTGQAAGSLTM